MKSIATYNNSQPIKTSSYNRFPRPMKQQSQYKQHQFERPPKKLITCAICNDIFCKPLTLSCGHTFCRQCLKRQITPKKTNTQTESQINQPRRQKLNICFVCSNIIWANPSQLRQNLAIQNVIQKFYNREFEERNRDLLRKSQLQQQQTSQLITSQFYNKILIKIKEPPIIPMPFCFSEIQFDTAFIDDIKNQAKAIIITWDSLLEKKLGLLCSIIKTESLNSNSTFSRIIYSIQQSNEVLDQKFKAVVQGLRFVNIDDTFVVSINLRHKLIILGDEPIDKVYKDLEICSCSIFHSQNSKKTKMEQLTMFFKCYQQLNNPHYMRQVHSQIFDMPLQMRQQPEHIIYCALRILKIPNQLRRKLVLSFDDSYRIQQINTWLEGHKAQPIDQKFNIKIPGKVPFEVVIFAIFILFAFNLLKDFNNEQM